MGETNSVDVTMIMAATGSFLSFGVEADTLDHSILISAADGEVPLRFGGHGQSIVLEDGGDDTSLDAVFYSSTSLFQTPAGPVDAIGGTPEIHFDLAEGAQILVHSKAFFTNLRVESDDGGVKMVIHDDVTVAGDLHLVATSSGAIEFSSGHGLRVGVNDAIFTDVYFEAADDDESRSVIQFGPDNHVHALTAFLEGYDMLFSAGFTSAVVSVRKRHTVKVFLRLLY